MKGIIILALGHPYWGRWAQNLAMSIKAVDPTANITLLFAGDGASQIYNTSIFNRMKEVPPNYYTSYGRVEWMKAKTAIYKLTPYKETIYLDADMIWINSKPISQLFNELSTVDFTMANRGWMDLESEILPEEFGVWASPAHIKEYFKFKSGRFYNLSSEMIYFRKSKTVGKLFNDAMKLWDAPINHRIFNGGMPDELPYTISMIKNNQYPHKDNYNPFYWEAAQNPPLRLTGGDLKGYYAYSMGGHMAHPIMKKNYDNLVKYYGKLFNIVHPYLWIDKRGWMPGRANL